MVTRNIHIQTIEVRFKAVDESGEEFDVLIEDQLVGSYNSTTNQLFVESVGAEDTLTGALMGAVMHQFKLHPSVVH